LPARVERDLRATLDCGILARAFARVRHPRLQLRAARGLQLQGAQLPLPWGNQPPWV